MGQKRNKSKHTRAAAANANAPLQQPKIVAAWDEYMGGNELQDFQRLLKDLGFENVEANYPSKTKCRQAFKTVWVNIPDFLDAVKKGEHVYGFLSEYALAEYTKKTRKFYPKRWIVKGSPLQQLLRGIRIPKKSAVDYDASRLVALMGGLSVV
ncbi:hypothetical protein F5Y03DRAFT_305527 [Xylaria venustula]|nr:hypothetical protein F5Y03DRAFT_305527 [Xylaria venustula]